MKTTSLYRSNSPPFILPPLCIGICIYTVNHVTATTVTSPVALSVAKWTLQSSPNGLWLFALLNIYRLFFKKHSFYQNLLWLTIITTLAFSTEYLQAFHIILDGTFDILDLLFYEFACIATMYIAFTNQLENLLHDLK